MWTRQCDGRLPVKTLLEQLMSSHNWIKQRYTHEGQQVAF